MTKSYIKSKSEPNAVGPKFNTPDHFKGSIFSGGGSKFSGGGGKMGMNQPKFNPGQFRTQHKG